MDEILDPETAYMLAHPSASDGSQPYESPFAKARARGAFANMVHSGGPTNAGASAATSPGLGVEWQTPSVDGATLRTPDANLARIMGVVQGLAEAGQLNLDALGAISGIDSLGGIELPGLARRLRTGGYAGFDWKQFDPERRRHGSEFGADASRTASDDADPDSSAAAWDPPAGGFDNIGRGGASHGTDHIESPPGELGPSFGFLGLYPSDPQDITPPAGPFSEQPTLRPGDSVIGPDDSDPEPARLTSLGVADHPIDPWDHEKEELEKEDLPQPERTPGSNRRSADPDAERPSAEARALANAISIVRWLTGIGARKPPSGHGGDPSREPGARGDRGSGKYLARGHGLADEPTWRANLAAAGARWGQIRDIFDHRGDPRPGGGLLVNAMLEKK